MDNKLLLLLFIFNSSYAQLISQRKCQEYGKAVYAAETSPVLMHRQSKPNQVSQCGIVSVPLIIGGVRANEKEFPHMAIIGYGAANSPELWSCGGSLISELYVVTAAHCLNSREYGLSQKVRLGLINLKNPGPELQEKRIAIRISHPDFQASSKYNDIGLLRMDSPVSFTPYVRPACLNTNPSLNHKTAIATGFGKLNFDSKTGSPDLMKVDLTLYTNNECSKTFNSESIPTLTNGLRDSMLCAGLMTGGKDTCQGDSGGPLQTVLKEPYCMYNLIGITSFGQFCGFVPAIYTKISMYFPWIESIVWN